MTPTEALAQIEKDQYKIVTSEVSNLFTDLKFISPVDSGNFRHSWSMFKTSKLSWRISNTALYADVLARGRRFVNGRYEGSLQWANGLSPMLQKTSKNIERRNNAIYY